MSFTISSFVKLTAHHNIEHFDCGDEDLNDFMLHDAKPYADKLLAVTYLIYSGEQVIAFFSLLNDKISITDMDSNRQWGRKFTNEMPDGKRFKSYPAVKLGRLGIHKDFQGKGIGTSIIDYIKTTFITNSSTGCLFITVDAYKQSLKFYKDNNFDFLSEKDAEKHTRLMFFNLTPLVVPAAIH